jgi:hypothetical protein
MILSTHTLFPDSLSMNGSVDKKPGEPMETSFFLKRLAWISRLFLADLFGQLFRYFCNWTAAFMIQFKGEPNRLCSSGSHNSPYFLSPWNSQANSRSDSAINDESAVDLLQDALQQISGKKEGQPFPAILT